MGVRDSERVREVTQLSCALYLQRALFRYDFCIVYSVSVGPGCPNEQVHRK